MWGNRGLRYSKSHAQGFVCWCQKHLLICVYAGETIWHCDSWFTGFKEIFYLAEASSQLPFRLSSPHIGTVRYNKLHCTGISNVYCFFSVVLLPPPVLILIPHHLWHQWRFITDHNMATMRPNPLAVVQSYPHSDLTSAKPNTNKHSEHTVLHADAWKCNTAKMNSSVMKMCIGKTEKVEARTILKNVPIVSHTNLCNEVNILPWRYRM